MTAVEEYFATIPPTHRAATESMAAHLSQWASDIDLALQPFVFLLDQCDHPVYPDAAEVFDLAAEQMLLASTPRTNEVPLLFVGHHAMNRFTRSRQTQGFLVTDQRILVQEDFAALLGRALPKHRMLPITSPDPVAAGHALITAVAKDCDWADMSKLVRVDDATSHPLQFQISQLLIDAVTRIVQLSQALGLSEPGEQEADYTEPTAAELIPRLVELGIRDKVRLADDPKLPKLLKKFATKIGMGDDETVVFCVLDKTFAGAYGLVVTDKAVRSCDLMESPVSSLLDSIDPESVRLDAPKTAMITEPDKAHILLSHLSESEKSRIVSLVRELVAGEVTP